MNEKLIVNIKDRTYEVDKNTTLLELSKNFKEDFKYDIILATVNGKYTELNEKISVNSKIVFYDLTDRYTNKVYINGLIFLTYTSIKELLGLDTTLKVKYSIDKGLYLEVNKVVTEETITALENKMIELVNKELNITKTIVSRIDSINYLKSIDELDKANLLKYNTNTNITLYKMGNLYNYFYSLMPHNTEVLKQFALTHLNSNGFVLRFPTVYMDKGIKKYEHRENIDNMYNDLINWQILMNLDTVSKLNEKVSTGKISDIIRISETLNNNKLLEVAKDLVDRKNIRIVLIAGPSSSGKTTTTKKLAMYLRSFGLNPKYISMDDYFVERDQTPIGEDNEPDYENITAVDLELFNKQMKELSDKKEVNIPTFNFVLGIKEYKRKMILNDNDIVLIEGIHALNNSLLENISNDNKCKIYLSPFISLNLDNLNRISSTDNRLLRRIIRDNRTRGKSVEETLEDWKKVRAGEEKNIFPYQSSVDITINTSLIYELGVLKTYVEPLLYSVDTNSVVYNEAKGLLNMLRTFLPIPSDDIPNDSVLREFIGKSCFNEE